MHIRPVFTGRFLDNIIWFTGFPLDIRLYLEGRKQSGFNIKAFTGYTYSHPLLGLELSARCFQGRLGIWLDIKNLY